MCSQNKALIEMQAVTVEIMQCHTKQMKSATLQKSIAFTNNMNNT